MLSRILKFIIGLLLIPVVISISVAFFDSLAGIDPVENSNARIFLWGVISYAILHLFLHKPKYAYTLGHEVTHALTAWLSGGSVKAIKVSKEGGSTETTKTNFFIALSPYLIPVHTLILSLFYFIIPFFINIPNLKPAYLFLAGFTLALHLVFTAEVLKTQQPDLIKTGYLFSLAVIYIVNISLVALVLSFLFKGVQLEEFFYNTYIKAKEIYVATFTQLF